MMLHELPFDHQQRNIPLEGCWYRWKNAKVWKEIKPSLRIARNTYNELGAAWTDNDLFCFTPCPKP